ncbi:hypothetical protein [Alcanivorax profundi]|uniref:hypothetical protein n=1 Tax=Alcanivorax profundi TaxID=2338368 RepID=UPI0032B28349
MPQPGDEITGITGPYPPVMSRESFAEWIGVSDGVVRGWVERREIPTVKVAKRRMINVLAFVQMVQEQDHD